MYILIHIYIYILWYTDIHIVFRCIYIYNYTYVCARQHLPQHNFQLVFKKHCVRIGCFGILLKTDIYIYTCVCNTLHIYIKNFKKTCVLFYTLTRDPTAWDDPWRTTEDLCYGMSHWLRWGIYGMWVYIEGIWGYTGISNLSIPYSHLSLGYDHSFEVCGPPICWGPLSKMRASGVSNNLWISFPIGWLVEGFVR